MKKIVWLIGTFISMNAAIGMDHHDPLDQDPSNVRKVPDNKILQRWDEFTEGVSFTSQIVLLNRMLDILKKDQIDSVEFKRTVIADDISMTLTSRAVKLLLEGVERRLGTPNDVPGFLEELAFRLKYIKNGKEYVKYMKFDCEKNK